MVQEISAPTVICDSTFYPNSNLCLFVLENKIFDNDDLASID